jgi:hypothetical protein
VNRLILVVAVFVFSVEAAGEVFSRRPMISLVRPFNLPAVCGTTRPIEACTRFVGQVLTCACEANPISGWRMSARAQFIPMIYMTSGEHLAHEHEHIRDIAGSVGSYAERLESLSFDSLEECERVASEETSRFPRTMDRFKDESNALRDPGYQRIYLLTENW